MLEIIEQIIVYNASLLRNITFPTTRDVASSINWDDRLIGIWGQKGVGKTTLLLGKLVENQKLLRKVIYLSLDHPKFSSISLIELAEAFSQMGGTIIYLDEVHKYENWAKHLKAIYDTHKNLKIIFSGSSALHLQRGRDDLSRRASMYKLPILSFREFLSIETKQEFKILKLTELVNQHINQAEEILKTIKPLEFFQKYLEYGAYPFYQESLTSYHKKLVSVITHTLESDLVFIHGLDARYSSKLKNLLNIIANSVPFVPKITDLAQATELSRPTVTQYLNYLEEGGLVRLIQATGRGYQKLSKPDKIYLDNTNLQYALALENIDIGTKRETFCVSQLQEAGCMIEVDTKADFLINSKYTFEVGGKNKKSDQIKEVPNSYLICDDIEIGTSKKIPLWLLGFLY